MEWTRGRALGHGSTATVSLGTSTQSPHIFAVKSAELFHSDLLRREQKILSSTCSPHLVSYMGCDVTTENNKVMFNIFLEYMPGGSLVDVILRDGGQLDESLIRCYTSQIVHGLDYMHLNGLVHCDIKGRNILIGESGAKIADLGCAKRVSAVATVPIGGTPMFMAPEVARGEEQGFASDIWGLGCTLIEMTGRAPWPHVKDPVSIIYQVGYSDRLPEFPCCLSEQARDFLDKCLRRDPTERWTARQLLKHPFLGEVNNSRAKQTHESKSTSSNSPTSILDQGFWNSLDESEHVCDMVHSTAENSSGERIRRLSLVSGGPSWDWDENWVTVRESCCCSEEGDPRMDNNGAEDEMISHWHDGGRDEMLLDLLDSKMSTGIDGDFRGTCKFVKERLVVSNLRIDKDKDMLLVPSISRLILQA